MFSFIRVVIIMVSLHSNRTLTKTVLNPFLSQIKTSLFVIKPLYLVSCDDRSCRGVCICFQMNLKVAGWVLKDLEGHLFSVFLLFDYRYLSSKYNDSARL